MSVPFPVNAREGKGPFFVETPEGIIEVLTRADADAIAAYPLAQTREEFMAVAAALKTNYDTAAQRLYRQAVEKAGAAK